MKAEQFKTYILNKFEEESREERERYERDVTFLFKDYPEQTKKDLVDKWMGIKDKSVTEYKAILTAALDENATIKENIFNLLILSIVDVNNKDKYEFLIKELIQYHE